MSVEREVHLQIVRLMRSYLEKGLISEDTFAKVRLGRYVVQTPEKIVARLTPSAGEGLYDLSYFRCVGCGRVYNVEARRGIGRNCPACGKYLVQVPLHFPYKSSYVSQVSYQPPVTRYARGEPRAAIFSSCGRQDPNSECPVLWRGRRLRFVKRIVRLNPGRPLASLRWGCPFVDVSGTQKTLNYFDEEGVPQDVLKLFSERSREREYEDVDGTRRLARVDDPRNCPFFEVRNEMPLCLAEWAYGRLRRSREPVRLSVPLTSARWSSISQGDYSFSLNVPMEPAFKNLLGEFHVVEEKVSLDESVEPFAPLVDAVYYCSKLRVYAFTFGTHYGHPDASRKRRVFYARELQSGQTIEFWGRQMTTEGIVFRFDSTALSAAVRALQSAAPDKYANRDRENIAEIVVHSVGHLLWKSAVTRTGLNYDEFGESIIVSEDGCYEFALYDSADGGLGGVRSLLSYDNGRPVALDPDVIEFASRSVVCESFCEWACRACIVIPSCHRGNYDLDWRVLGAVLPNLRGALEA